jgi:hypothetical protein
MNKEAMTLALEALGEILESFETDGKFCKSSLIRNELFDGIKATFEKCKAIADVEQEQGEPAAKYIGEDWSGSLVSLYDDIPLNTLLYTTPQPAQKPLTDEQISKLWCKVSNTDFVTADTHVFARAIEAAHGTKENTCNENF